MCALRVTLNGARHDVPVTSRIPDFDGVLQFSDETPKRKAVTSVKKPLPVDSPLTVTRTSTVSVPKKSSVKKDTIAKPKSSTLLASPVSISSSSSSSSSSATPATTSSTPALPLRRLPKPKRLAPSDGKQATAEREATSSVSNGQGAEKVKAKSEPRSKVAPIVQSVNISERVTVAKAPKRPPGKPCSVVIRGLEKSVTAEILLLHVFHDDGDILQVLLHTDENGVSRGTAEVVFATEREAKAAIARHADELLNGRRLLFTPMWHKSTVIKPAERAEVPVEEIDDGEPVDAVEEKEEEKDEGHEAEEAADEAERVYQERFRRYQQQKAELIAAGFIVQSASEDEDAGDTPATASVADDGDEGDGIQFVRPGGGGSLTITTTGRRQRSEDHVRRRGGKRRKF